MEADDIQMADDYPKANYNYDSATYNDPKLAFELEHSMSQRQDDTI